MAVCAIDFSQHCIGQLLDLGTTAGAINLVLDGHTGLLIFSSEPHSFAVDCRLLHTALMVKGSDEDKGGLLLGFFGKPFWIKCWEATFNDGEAGEDEDGEGGALTAEVFLKHLLAAHSQHRRRSPQASPQLDGYVIVEGQTVEAKGVEDSPWRACQLNQEYSVCETYPKGFVVPSSISDSVLRHASKHRVKNRLPILSHQHGPPTTGPVLIRSGQPLVGLKRNRSVQDEHLIQAYRTLNGTIPDRQMLIIDARPTFNALANTIVGAGFEPLEWYKGCDRQFVNLENIHQVRSAFLRIAVEPFAWIVHTKRLLLATATIVTAMTGENPKAILVHCSDGWDRTSQLVSLAKICLSSKYRTLEGLAELIKDDWLDAGHRFDERLAHNKPIANSLSFISPGLDNDPIASFISSLTKPSLKQNGFDHWCPIFPQFLDCILHLIAQHPDAFGYGREHIERIYAESMQNETGLFSGNCEAERKDPWNQSRWENIVGTPLRAVNRNPSVLVPDLDCTITSMFQLTQ